MYENELIKLVEAGVRFVVTLEQMLERDDR